VVGRCIGGGGGDCNSWGYNVGDTQVNGGTGAAVDGAPTDGESPNYVMRK